MAVESFNNLVIFNSAILAASKNAFLYAWVKYAGTATTAYLF
jgi:hypothetical protein